MIRFIAAVFAMAAFCGTVTAGISSKAEALRVEAETGNPLHIVREGKGESPVLAIHNAAQERIAAHGTLRVEGFGGDVFDLPVDVAINAGETVNIPVQAATAKGVWKIRGELAADDGSVASVDTRFAVMDFHGVTPKQPRGKAEHSGQPSQQQRAVELIFQIKLACNIQLFLQQDRPDKAEIHHQPDGQ